MGMKIRLGALRRIIREEAHDTVMTPTQSVPASPESMKDASHPALKNHDPVASKANQVVKVIQSHGQRADVRDVQKFISSLSPQRALVISAEDMARAFMKKTSN